MKKLLSIMLAIAVLLSMMVNVSAWVAPVITVTIDGEALECEMPPLMENDRVLVPMRAIFEALGAEVEWNEKNQMIEAYINNTVASTHLTLHINSNIMSRTRFSHTAEPGGAGVPVERIELDVPSKIVYDRTFVPLRAVSEAFDCNVQWDGDTKTVTITSKKSETDMLSEYKILNGRLKVSVGNGWDVKEGFRGSDTWIGLYKNNSCINMSAYELGCITAGNLSDDVNNLGYELIGEVTAQNEIEFVCIGDETSDNTYKKNYLVKSSDNYLILIEFSGELKYLSADDIEEEVEAVMNSISAGGMKINTSARRIRLDYLSINLPEGYFADLEYGKDFDGWKIKKIVSSEVKNAPSISIYYGYEPSYNELYKSNKPYKTVKSEFIGNKIEWLLYKEDSYMQAIYQDGDLYYHLYAYAESAEQQQEFIKLVSEITENGTGKGAKPVIYLYPEYEQEVSAKLNLDGKFTFTYPEYNNGWTVTAKPDGTLIADGKEYSYLFWEGEMPNFKPDFKEGFVVKGSESTEFLRTTLEKMGLTPREYNEFIVYWAPKLQENEYNKIYFAQEEYEECAELDITPKPDSMLRVFMVYEKADKDTALSKQEIKPFERNGFTVIEWGGYSAE